MYYDTLTRFYQGWSLTEIKQMPHRERKFWLDLMRWRMDQVVPNV